MSYVVNVSNAILEERLNVTRAGLLDRLGIIAAGGAGELTPAGAALLPRLDAIAAGLADGVISQLILDRIDAAISSRTTGSLANLDAAVSSRAPANESPIQSVQYGTMTIAANVASGTATITSVNTAKAVVIYLGLRTSATSDNTWAKITLTNATTVTADRQGSPANDEVVGFVVVEFK